MTLDAIAHELNLRPFRPFVLHASDHNQYLVDHPELVLVAERALYIFERIPGSLALAGPTVLAYEHIVKLYPYKQEAA